MSRPRKPARLYLRPDTQEWIIRGLPDGRDRRTGCVGEGGREAAERALAAALTEAAAGAPAHSADLPISSVLIRYAADRGGQVAKPKLIADAIDALGEFWSGKPTSFVSMRTCREYVEWRCGGGLRRSGRAGSRETISQSTARRDLGVLRAALAHAKDVGLLIGELPRVELPAETPGRDNALTRDEAAAILRELWRGPWTTARDGSQHRAPAKSRHAARLFWILTMTGSRFNAVAQATRNKRKDGPWVDLSAGIWHRRGSAEQRTKKGRGPHVIPGPLLLALERWQRMFPDQTYIIERAGWPGRPVSDIGAALQSACERAGVNRAVPHDLKHTAITWFVISGGDLMRGAEYFSTSYQTMLSQYAHLSPSFQREALPTIARRGKPPAHRNAQKPRETGPNSKKDRQASH